MKDTNDDLSLIQQVAELHDKTAFDRLVRKYQSPIRRFFLHQTLGDAQLSDDLDAARPAAAGTDQSLGMDVYGALARLPDAERTCVTLQLVDGYPIERIAAITGMAEGTVKSHLFRGKQKLTAFLRQNGYS